MSFTLWADFTVLSERFSTGITNKHVQSKRHGLHASTVDYVRTI